MLLPTVLALCLISSIHGEKLHDHMTNDEIRSIFNVHRDDVHKLDYQVVKIIHIDPGNRLRKMKTRMRKAEPQLNLKAFDQNYTLYLEENGNILLGDSTPVFIAETSSDKIRSSKGQANIVYSKIRYPFPRNFKLYHDVANRAAVSVHHENDDRFHVNGIVGDDLVIRSLPLRIHKEYLSKDSIRSKRSAFFNDVFSNSPFLDSNSVFGNNIKTTHHVIMRSGSNQLPPVFGSLKNTWSGINNNFLHNDPEHTFGNSGSWGNIKNKFNFSEHSFNTDDGSSSSFVRWYTSFNSSDGLTHLTWRPIVNLPTASWMRPSVEDPDFWYRPTTSKPVTESPAPTRTRFPPRISKTEPTKGSFISNLPIGTRFPPRIPKTEPTKGSYISKLPTGTRFPPRIPKIEPINGRFISNLPIGTRLPPRFPQTEPIKRPIILTSEANNKETIYPELLITVDYDTYKTHGSNVEEVAKYIAAFWNAVDLRYREIDNPNVRLNIAGLIIPKQPYAAVYMEEYKVSANSVEAGNTLNAIGNYFSKHPNEFPTNSYDIVVGITNKLLGEYEKNGQFNDGITGMAGFEGACGVQYGVANALISDKGGFNGITTAAHEVAHSLGAPHDGPESATVPGGPCAWNDGYLMSYARKDKNGVHFSKCSVRAMQTFFKRREAACLRNKPITGSSYPKILPGRLLSRDEQCQRTMGNEYSSYKDQENNCAALWCLSYASGTVVTHYRPPAEGSYCAKNAICLNAECVKDPELF